VRGGDTDGYGGDLSVDFLDHAAFFEYGRPNVILMSVASFLLLSSEPVRSWLRNRPRFVIWTRTLASVSFGVFLIHPLLLQIVMPRLGLAWNSFGPLAGIMVSVFALLSVSALAVWILRQIPWLRVAVS
jgi:surface polysaccharide O-acyltransferase-like enzyme